MTQNVTKNVVPIHAYLAKTVDDGTEIEFRHAAVKDLIEEPRQLRRNGRCVDAAARKHKA